MRKLQRFDFANSKYERPNRNWVCGHAADGNACHMGPDARGRCCTVAECKPRRDGDRWVCTRPTSAGGACEPGPMADGTCACPVPPCAPVRSMRGKRGLAVRWAVVAALGFVAIALGSSGLKWAMPGPLTRAHLSLENCQSCHATVSQGAFGWVHSAFVAASPEKDNARCLGCHVAGNRPMLAHGVAPEILAAETRRIAARMPKSPANHDNALLPALFSTSFPSDQPLACATCHIEHRGNKAVLTEIAESDCQTCHIEKFAGFTAGHPEFDAYPYDRRTRIVFDHASHFARHFPEVAKRSDGPQKTFAACVDCHMPAANGKLMANGSFEETCAACHLDQIRGRDRAIGPRGIAFLVVPGIDAQTLEDRGYNVGGWPRDAEAGLTPFMTMLLSADPDTRAAIEETSKHDLLDLRDADDATLAAAYKLAWAVKGLFRELTDGGGKNLRDRLGAATGNAPDDAMLANLMASIPRDVLASAGNDWLPALDKDLAAYAAGKMAPAPKPRKSAAVSADAAASKSSKDTGDILGAAPKRDTGDILGAAPKQDTGDILGAAPKQDTGDILGAAPKQDTGDILGAAPKQDTGDILGGAPKKDTGDILGAAPKQDTGDILGAAPKKDTGDILGAAPIGKVDILSGSEKPAAAKPAADAEAPKPVAVDAEAFARLGGWYRQNFSVLFLPTGHADPFLKTWLEYTASAFGTPAQAAAEPVFAELSNKDAQGQCSKCHSVEKRASGQLAVMWQPRNLVGTKAGFTEFSHGPHLQLGPERGCLTCHQLDRDAAYLKSYTQHDPRAFASNFTPISREVCASCHTAEAAGDSCLQCHNYHVDSVATPVMATKLSDTLTGDAAKPQ